MTTYADLLGRVADDLDRSDLSQQIDRELRRAVMHYERQRWWFNEQQATASTSSSQEAYGLPADLLILDDLEITINSRRHRMNEIQWSRYLDEYRYNNVVGQPYDWAMYSDQIWLGPVPNQVYTLNLNYIRTLRPESFTDGTSNEWTNFADDLITARALKTLGARPLQLVSGTLVSWQALEVQALKSLEAMNEQRLMTGLARPWSG